MIFVSFEYGLKVIYSLYTNGPTNSEGHFEPGHSMCECACVTFCVGNILKTDIFSGKILFCLNLKNC